MRYLTISAAVVALVGTAACARSDGDPGGPPPEFTARARVVADTWLVPVTAPAWRRGLLPLQDLTVAPAGEDVSDALRGGRFAAATRLSTATPAAGAVRFPGGATEPVPLISAAAAFDALRDAAPCPEPTPPGAPPQEAAPAPPGAPPEAATGPPGPAGRSTGPPGGAVGGPVTGCPVLTVTAAELGTTALRTSRGVATVPAWLFTVAGLREPVARVAVAPGAVTPAPAPSAPPAAGPKLGVAAAQHLTAVDGRRLDFTVGVGACQSGPRGLAYETDHVVVIGGDPGTARPGGCPAILVYEPVSVTLAGPLGDRPVVDAVTGRLLPLGRVAW